MSGQKRIAAEEQDHQMESHCTRVVSPPPPFPPNFIYRHDFAAAEAAKTTEKTIVSRDLSGFSGGPEPEMEFYVGSNCKGRSKEENYETDP